MKLQRGWVRGAACLVSMAGVFGLLSCSTLLGFEDLQAAGQDASAPGTDAGSEAETPSDAASDSEAPGDGGDGGCGDTQTDPRNCGACNHDCLAGDCSEGKCLPAMLVGGLESPAALAVDGDRVFVALETTNGKVLGVPKKGGAKKTVADGYWVAYPCSLALDAAHLYFGDCVSPDGLIMSCPIAGCDTVEPARVALADYPHALVRTGTDLFWTEQETGRVMRLAPGSDGGAGLEVVPAIDGMPDRLVERDGILYFTDSRWYHIYRVNTDGSDLADITGSSEMRPWGLATGGPYLFWATEGVGDGRLWRWTLGSAPGAGTETVIADYQADPRDVAADGQNVYWVTAGTDPSVASGQVLSCPHEGCGSQPDLVADEQGQPTHIVVDDQAIYWINAGIGAASNGGSVMILAR